MKNLANGWTKLPSTRRNGRWFYHNSALRLWALQDWQDDLWRIVDTSDKAIAGPFPTARAALSATGATK